jgi:hypothetical protein
LAIISFAICCREYFEYTVYLKIVFIISLVCATLKLLSKSFEKAYVIFPLNVVGIFSLNMRFLKINPKIPNPANARPEKRRVFLSELLDEILLSDI